MQPVPSKSPTVSALVGSIRESIFIIVDIFDAHHEGHVHPTTPPGWTAVARERGALLRGSTARNVEAKQIPRSDVTAKELRAYPNRPERGVYAASLSKIASGLKSHGL